MFFTQRTAFVVVSLFPLRLVFYGCNMREFVLGVGSLFRGFALWGTSARMMLLGAIPALLVGVLYVVLAVVLVTNLDGLVALATWFAADWPDVGRVSLRIGVGVSFVIGAILLLVFTYTAVVLAVGEPFYERIWRRSEARLGNAPVPPEERFMTGLRRGIGNGLRLLGSAILMALLLVVVGLVPVVGPIVAAILGAFWGGWSLAIQLTGYAFDGRGLTLTQRLNALRARRARSLGFGIATYLLLLIPGLAIVLMPVAVAGATSLAREMLQPASPATPS
jgi:CysZ protein